mmetsp:Transcript_60912/g.145163  ORF Transcript_60912/g.145163 Transcript_60912/m.145163 type:complete len:300 (-) Transcript_60912:74-973(-)
MELPFLAAGRVAVITGSASGIGLAMAKRCAAMGMKVFLADNDPSDLPKAVEAVTAAAGGDASRVGSKLVDVGDMASVQALKDEVYAKFGEVGFLMNNAGIGGGAGPFEKYDTWVRTLQINLWGVINCVQAFTDAMVAQGTPAMICNTGSKQGITCPPGNTAYNVSKAGVKVLTEGLQHELRSRDGCKVEACLLVPGWVNTELVRKNREHAAGGPVDLKDIPFCEAKPAAGAWMPEQVVDYFLDKMKAGKFYIICPDNDVTEETDIKRMQWTASDIPSGRPPLSRWHPDYKAEFEAFMKA